MLSPLRNIIKPVLRRSILYSPNLLRVDSPAAGFCIATIVLAVDNANLRSDLQEAENKGHSTSTPITPTTPKPPDMSKYRLPRSVAPLKYDLYLYPNLQAGNYTGKVTTTISVTKPTNVITVHSKGLSVKSAKIDGEEATVELDLEYELLKLRKKSGQVVSVKTATMEIEFEGDMKNKLVGLYESSYKGTKGLRTIATSKFEPTYARQAFPCFDEPNMKATYTVHLWKPNDPDYIALSNFPQAGPEEDFNGGKMVHFQETVSMSTYLTCFIVSDFNYTETSFNNKGKPIPFRVYATPEQLDKTQYAGIVGQKAIEYYIDYFDLDYPLPKLDMVAIPDFSSGAMEHWGLVTYRETALLYTPDTHSTENKQRVVTVVAHELAHSWFGNLVTMDWWDNLWLNEGFASYIEYKGGNSAEPTFGWMEQFLTRDLHPVLNLDAKLSSHPIIQEVGTPDQITEVFDTINYNKGASVLRMLEYSVGDENFKKGVTNYLKKHQFGNAVTNDLWSEIQDVVGPSMNVREFMDTFTIQMGYPILNVSVDGNKYTFTQKRFLANPDDVQKQKPSPLGYKWTIPITYITDKGKSATVTWFNKTQDSVSIEKPADAKWLKFNYDQAGYYRVNYPENLWKELGSNMLQLSVSDRTHLLEEAFSIAKSGQLSYEIPLELTKYLKDENSYTPWSVASTMLQNIHKLLTSSQYEQKLKEYVIQILSPIYKNVTWSIGKNDEHLTKLNRIVILKLACAMEYEPALKEASSLLDAWFSVRSASPDIREIIYHYGMKTANKEKWDKMFNIFKEETDSNERLKQLRGLTAVNDPTILSNLLELAKDETVIRKQDYYHFIGMMSRNPVGQPIVWDYVRENWKDLVKRFTLNDRHLGEMIPMVTSSFSTNTKLQEMEAFFTTYPEAGAGTAARNRALENVKNNIVWLSKYKDIVGKWIVDNSS